MAYVIVDLPKEQVASMEPGQSITFPGTIVSLRETAEGVRVVYDDGKPSMCSISVGEGPAPEGEGVINLTLRGSP